jgi:histidinol phosphatase-like PHP family hydrolase
MEPDRDLHVHSFFSPCADPAMSFHTILDRAEAAGLRDVGVTDHPYRDGLGRHHGQLALFRASRPSSVRIWIGAELEVAAMGRLVLSRSELPHADYIVAAPSHYDLAGHPPVPDLSDPAQWADRLLTDLENVPGSGADAVAHPFFVYSLQAGVPAELRLPPMEDVLAEIRPRRLDWLLERLAADGIALEISPRSTYLAVFAAFMEGVYRRARAAGVKFLLGSDAHRPEAVGDFSRLAGMLADLDLAEDDLWHPGGAGPA